MSIIVLDKKKNKIREDGVLVSCDADEKVNLAPVQGSFYTEMMQKLNERIKKKGDWKWLVDGLKNQTDDILMASEVESLTKRYVFHDKLVHKLGLCNSIIKIQLPKVTFLSILDWPLCFQNWDSLEEIASMLL